jgi:hypothetical protein
MSFSAVASYNIGSDLFDQTYEELSSDFFDQFLTFSPPGSETLEYPNLSDSTYLDTGDGHSGGTSLDSTDDETKHSIIDNTWQGESWAFTQDEASLHSAQGNAFYAELSGRAAVSDSELLSLEGITLDSPQIAGYSHNSLPSSPSPSATLLEQRKNRLVESLSKTVRKATGSIDRRLRSPIRRSTSSPAMKPSHSNLADNWGQKLALDAEKFSFDFEKSLAPLSPPPSARISEQSQNSLAGTKQNPLNGFSDNIYLTKPTARQTAYDPPMATPPLDADHRRSASFQQPPPDFFPLTPQPQSVSASWSQIPGSSEFNAYEASTLYLADADAPVWWNHAASVPVAQPSPSSFHSNPQQATKSLAMQLQNGTSYGVNDLGFDPSNMASGLMIQMPELAAQQSFVMGTSPMMRQGYFAASRSQPHYNTANRQRAHAHSRQPQSSSPIRKNRSGSSDSGSPSPTLPVRKRKSPKNNKNSTPRTPSMPETVDFVNFTPSDSRKILTGVAPSGSSKTKARREKEALEKRRKLSQAAMRAVRDAGGDIESLVEQGLFV